jgi:2-dehydropantoate 2-reductase
MEPIHVVGIGGIGCAIGYALRAAGADVRFVDSDPTKLAWGRQHGVSVDRHPALPAEFQHFDDWQPSAGTIVLLCTKCYDNAAVLARLPAAIILLPIQNGFDPALEAHSHGPEGIASFVSECDPQRTHTRITRGGCLHLGFRGLSTPDRKQADALAGITDGLRRSTFFRVTSVPDILPYKYTKLMYNAAISPLAAAAGLDNGQLLTVPRARQLFFDLLQENYAILQGASISLGKIGPFHPSTVARILRRPAVAYSLAWAFYPTLRKTYCSMSGDLPKGRTEIDYYNRHLIELAKDQPCPLNRRVYDLVKRMEHERLPPRVEMLDELLQHQG